MRTNSVVLVTHADCDAGYLLARELLDEGYRVAATATQVSRLSRILLGQKPAQVMAIAADLTDPWQLSLVLQRTAARLGPVEWIVDGRTGSMRDQSLPISA